MYIYIYKYMYIYIYIGKAAWSGEVLGDQGQQPPPANVRRAVARQPANIYNHIHIYIYIYIYIFIYLFVCLHTHTYTHIHIHIYICRTAGSPFGCRQMGSTLLGPLRK